MDDDRSWASSPAARAVMKGNRRRDTHPEMEVRRACHALGLRYRVDARPLAGLNRRADLVFPRAMVAVFVDGCYWHSCPEHGTTSQTNTNYWGPKLAQNYARDRDTDRRLKEAGWHVVRAWEHEDASQVAAIVQSLVQPDGGGA